MEKILLDIVSLSHGLSQSPNYTVVLSERNGHRQIPIVIGSFEAQAIVVALEQMVTGRPLTHDLFKKTLDTFAIDVKEILIDNMIDGVFHAKLVCLKDGEIINIDSRTSDALALAVRFECPIYSYSFILDSVGVEPDEMIRGLEIEEVLEDEEEVVPTGPTGLSSYSNEDLNQLLEEVIADEDYERAAAIRDELQKREKAQ